MQKGETHERLRISPDVEELQKKENWTQRTATGSCSRGAQVRPSTTIRQEEKAKVKREDDTTRRVRRLVDSLSREQATAPAHGKRPSSTDHHFIASRTRKDSARKKRIWKVGIVQSAFFIRRSTAEQDTHALPSISVRMTDRQDPRRTGQGHKFKHSTRSPKIRKLAETPCMIQKFMHRRTSSKKLSKVQLRETLNEVKKKNEVTEKVRFQAKTSRSPKIKKHPTRSVMQKGETHERLRISPDVEELSAQWTEFHEALAKARNVETPQRVQ